MSRLSAFIEAAKGVVNVELHGAAHNVTRAAVAGLLAAASLTAVAATTDLGNNSKIDSRSSGAPSMTTEYNQNDKNGAVYVIKIRGNKQLASMISSDMGIKPIYAEMLVEHAKYHEKAHRDMLSGVAKAEFTSEALGSDVSDRINLILASDIHHPFSVLFAENYADAIGAMQFLEKNHFSKPAIKAIEALADAREAPVRMVRDDPSHYTHYTLRKVLASIPELKQANLDDKRSLANEIASEGSFAAVVARGPYSYNLSESVVATERVNAIIGKSISDHTSLGYNAVGINQASTFELTAGVDQFQSSLIKSVSGEDVSADSPQDRHIRKQMMLAITDANKMGVSAWVLKQSSQQMPKAN